MYIKSGNNARTSDYKLLWKNISVSHQVTLLQNLYQARIERKRNVTYINMTCLQTVRYLQVSLIQSLSN